MADVGRFGVWERAGDVSPNRARTIESLGFETLWVGGSPTGQLQEVQAALGATGSIVVATGIVNMWRDTPTSAAAAYHRIQGRYPNRFLLGVGIGHPETTAEYQNPYATIVGYLDELDAAGVPREHLVLAALGPRVLKLAATRTAGAHPYLTTPRHTELARAILGDGPLLAPEQTVVVSDDRAAARQSAGDFFARYLRLVNYRSNLLREGWSQADLDHGGSNQLRDEIIVTGDAPTVAAGIEAHFDAGADHVAIQALGSHPEDAYRSLAAVLYN